MQEIKVIVAGDYIDKSTGLRFIEDVRGDFHFCNMLNMSGMDKQVTVEIPPVTYSGNFTCSCSPEILVTIDLSYEKDKEIFELLSENAWLWGVIEQAIKDRKEKNCNYAMAKLEQAIRDRS